jgi:hypothetical protein
VFVFATKHAHTPLNPSQNPVLPFPTQKQITWTVLTAALISNEAQIAEMSNNVTNTTTGSSNISSADEKLLINNKTNSEVAMEIRQLREEESKLRLDNLQLRVSWLSFEY